jgi:hypothetical protein
VEIDALPKNIGERVGSIRKKRGHYLGTEINETWWRRYYRDGYFARGTGEFWIDPAALHFRRYLTKTPLVIPFGDVLDVKVGKWHAGRWAGGAPVVKIVWKKSDARLSSGFVLSRNTRETDALIQEIRSHIQKAASPAQQAHATDTATRRG